MAANLRLASRFTMTINEGVTGGKESVVGESYWLLTTPIIDIGVVDIYIVLVQ